MTCHVMFSSLGLCFPSEYENNKEGGVKPVSPAVESYLGPQSAPGLLSRG